MEGFFTVPKLLEIGFDTLSAAVGLFVVATALRVASAFTLSATEGPCESWPLPPWSSWAPR
jgi:hypothetical protein